MLRKIRQILAILLGGTISLLFLDFTGTIHTWAGWLPDIQFLPAVLAMNVGIVFFWILLTFILGRVYCSVICPLGVMQDVIAWFGKKKHRYTYSPAKSWLRYSVLVVFIISMVAGISSLTALLAPYSAYGRIVNNLFAPIYGWGNNVLAYIAERFDSYAFYETEIWLKSIPTFLIALLTFVVIGFMAWRNGRTYCNSICPVGTLLGFISRWSWFKLSIDTSKCVNCKLCARNCKASCIDVANHQIDYSRCVACMDCIENCHQGAIHYRHELKEATKVGMDNSSILVDESRRSFLSISALIMTTATIRAQKKKIDGGLAFIEDKKVPERKVSIVPPGALSIRNFAHHCTACQLCVSVCPNNVLRPSTKLATLMQPEMSYERGYCRPECTRCSEVCPTDAISKVSVSEKSAIQVGHAVWVPKNCIPLTDGVQCGNCARHCPTGAIQMVASSASGSKSLRIPVINVERCIGCGACENLCPARPFSAIYVEGNEVHRTI